MSGDESYVTRYWSSTPATFSAKPPNAQALRPILRTVPPCGTSVARSMLL